LQNLTKTLKLDEKNELDKKILDLLDKIKKIKEQLKDCDGSQPPKPNPEEKPKTEEKPVTKEKPKTEEKPKSVVCPTFDQWKCTADQDFQCDEGYYPVCADLSYWGYNNDNSPIASEEECKAKCDADKDKCFGYEFGIKDKYCHLNDA